MLGYEGYGRIKGATVLCTSGEIRLDRARIDSSAVYGGAREGANAPVGGIHFYDWPNVTGEISFDVTPASLSVLREICLARDTPFPVEINTRRNGKSSVEKAWWNSVTLSASEDSPVTASVSFTAISRDEFTSGDFAGHWSNVNGLLGSNCNGFSGLGPLNPSQGNNAPIPFWRTSVEGTENVRRWTVSLSQDVVRFMACQNISGQSASSPFLFGVGVMNGTFTYSTLPPSTSFPEIKAMPDVFSQIQVTSSRKSFTVRVAGATAFGLSCEINAPSDPLVQGGQISEIAWDWQIYKIS